MRTRDCSQVQSSSCKRVQRVIPVVRVVPIVNQPALEQRWLLRGHHGHDVEFVEPQASLGEIVK
jgi:hypothetical protein